MKRTFFFLQLTLTSLLFSQIKNFEMPGLTNIKKNEYKGGTQNWDITQDRNGNVYFANIKGLLRYDGSEWNLYTLPNKSTVRSVKTDSTGKIYVGGYNEFGYFAFNEVGRLVYHSLSQIKSNDKEIDVVWKIHLFEDEIIFQTFYKMYVLKNNTLTEISAPTRFQFSFLVNGRLYIQDINTGILEYKKGKLTLLENTNIFSNTEVWGIFPLPDSKLLFATMNRGLYTYDGKKTSIWNTEANKFVLKNNSLGGCYKKDEFIVLNSITDGMIICDLNGSIIQHINSKSDLQNNTVLSSFLDIDSNLWMGLDNGISFAYINSPISYYKSNNNLSSVYATVSHNGILYVATNQGLFYRSLKSNLKDRNFKLVEGTIGQVWNIQNIDGNLLCSHNTAAFLINNGKIIQKLDNQGYRFFKQIPAQPYIIGKSYNDMVIYKKTNNGFEKQNIIQSDVQNTNFFDIDENYIWMKRDKGAREIQQLVLSKDLKKLQLIKSYKSISKKIKGDCVIESFTNNIYFRINNHFFIYVAEIDSFVEDKKMYNLLKNINNIKHVWEDKYGNIWYFHKSSLGAFMKTTRGEFKNTTSPFVELKDNILDGYESVFVHDKNNIYMGLINGLAHYDSEYKKDVSAKPKVFIKSLCFGSDTIYASNIDKKTEAPDISYKNNQVKIFFSSPTFGNITNTMYSYILEPFDDKWSLWTTSPMKEYTNLREGDYSIKVKSRSNLGVISDTASYNFTISPPWYRHFIAYLLYLSLFTASIYYLRKRIEEKMNIRNRENLLRQEEIYLKREKESRKEQKLLKKEIEKLEHEKLKMKILSKDKELVNNTIQVAKKNKMLNQIINKIKGINIDKLDEESKAQLNKLKNGIAKEINNDNAWKDIEKHIKNVHFEFLKKLKEKHPIITSHEMDLCTYLLMNMSTKEIAEVMNISRGGVELARYRLRRKLNLNNKESLTTYLMSI